ncbi:hypothetical protein CC80DRAFT_9096 [Byssothecium circinans]|uniref:Uncharacterized protein n=1 Tax=Byssothecium circinans TaxID=147558 RepID=A0A6A5UFM7_9PLEO|nr:hypothetical protein CC80DRAFT_9096 [Byssothecium circinans]
MVGVRPLIRRLCGRMPPGYHHYVTMFIVIVSILCHTGPLQHSLPFQPIQNAGAISRINNPSDNPLCPRSHRPRQFCRISHTNRPRRRRDIHMPPHDDHPPQRLHGLGTRSSSRRSGSVVATHGGGRSRLCSRDVESGVSRCECGYSKCRAGLAFYPFVSVGLFSGWIGGYINFDGWVGRR